jgi:C-terminal processing protease CtpA/Prc
MRNYRIIILLAVLLFNACRKSDSDTGQPPASQADLMKDTAIAYTRDIYLWYDQIPNSFNARGYSDLNAMMEAIRTYSREPGFTDPVDRWSFAVRQSDWDNTSAGIGQDFGLNIFFRAEGDLRVRMVEPASPAGQAGIRRGWRITKINGNTNITTGNANFIVNAVYASSSVNISFLKPDGNTVDIPLNAASYQDVPVYLDTVYTAGSRKAGYMVYHSFLGDSAATSNAFAAAFNQFMSENVDDVIIDLRYNGGGFVSYQRELANYLAPLSANSQLMMKQEFNDKYSQYNSSTNFSKKGALNLNRVFVIVSDNTASASELLINNLKPYMDVIVVGPNRTYGKPVGYFNIPVGDWYIFPVSTRTTNKNGEGNYFNGFALNNTVADGLDKDFGDVSESCLASVLKYIGTGAFRMPLQEPAEPLSPEVENANRSMSRGDFKGMIAAPVRGIR